MRHDGVYRWIQDDGSPYIDETGEFKGYIGSCFDITENVETKKAIEENEHRFQILVNTIEDGFWVTNLLESRVLYVSPGITKLWDLDVEQFYGNPIHFINFILDEYKDDYIELIQKSHKKKC
jgi:PAS domain-containing protein